MRAMHGRKCHYVESHAILRQTDGTVMMLKLCMAWLHTIAIIINLIALYLPWVCPQVGHNIWVGVINTRVNNTDFDVFVTNIALGPDLWHISALQIPLARVQWVVNGVRGLAVGDGLCVSFAKGDSCKQDRIKPQQLCTCGTYSHLHV